MDRFPINWRRVGFFVVLALLTLVVIEFNNRLDEFNRLEAEAEILRAEATQAIQTQIALRTKVAYATSDVAVDDYAREDGNLIQEGDTPAVPYGSEEEVVTPTPTPVPTSTPMPNWQVWWNLFFGE